MLWGKHSTAPATSCLSYVPLGCTACALSPCCYWSADAVVKEVDKSKSTGEMKRQLCQPPHLPPAAWGSPRQHPASTQPSCLLPDGDPTDPCSPRPALRCHQAVTSWHRERSRPAAAGLQFSWVWTHQLSAKHRANTQRRCEGRGLCGLSSALVAAAIPGNVNGKALFQQPCRKAALKH